MKRMLLVFLSSSVMGLAYAYKQNVKKISSHTERLPRDIKDDTSKMKRVMLPEIAVAGVKGVQAIGLTNLPPDSGYRGKSGDRIAVYIPHPATTALYQVTDITINIKKKTGSSEARFEAGDLRIKLCRAVDANHPPNDSPLTQDLIIYPRTVRNSHTGYLEISLPNPIVLPEEGLFVVASWKYERTSRDEKNGSMHSATLAVTYLLSDTHTWTSVGDLIQTWQHEGDKNSITEITQSKGLFPQWKGKVYNALMGVKVKQVD